MALFSLMVSHMNKMFVGISLAVLVYATSQGTGVRPVFADAAGTLPVATAPASPIVTGFSPSTAPSGSLISITGEHFDNVTSVLFGNLSAKFIVTSKSQLTAIVPHGAVNAPITVVTLKGKSITPVSFKVGKPAPILISAIRPESGNTGALVQLSGQGFGSATTLSFNGVPGRFVVNSDTQITAVVPSGASSGPIKVSGLGGTAVSQSFSASE